jgi:hypothetical protein
MWCSRQFLLVSLLLSCVGRRIELRGGGESGLAYGHGTTVDPVIIDVHIPVSGEALTQVRNANKYLKSMLGQAGGEVDLTNRDTAHVTLYLTAWTCDSTQGALSDSCINRVAAAVASVLPRIVAASPCDLSITTPFASGQYAMMNVDVTSCLQLFSDTIVNASYHLAQPNQPVPEWVEALSEPQRSEKIRLVKVYGSPNVFSQFEAHVSAQAHVPRKVNATQRTHQHKTLHR